MRVRLLAPRLAVAGPLIASVALLGGCNSDESKTAEFPKTDGKVRLEMIKPSSAKKGERTGSESGEPQ